MTTRERSRITPAEPERTLAELQARVPAGSAHIVPLSSGGPWQLQTVRLVLATCGSRDVAEYLARLWNTIAPAAEGGDADRTGSTVPRPDTTTPPSRPRGGGVRRKAGKTVQVVP